MGEIKQTNFRLDEDRVAEFRAFCDSEGYNQAQGFDYLMNILALEQAKNIISNRETEITEFEMHSKALVDAFIRSLELCNNAEERIREDFVAQLNSKDKQIIDYQQKLATIETELKLSDDVMQKYMTNYQEAEAKIKELNEQMNTYRSSNEALTSSLALANEKAKENEEAAKRYHDAVKESELARKELEKKESQLNHLKEKHDNEIEILNHDHSAIIKQMEIQAELDKNAALATANKEYQEKVDAIKAEYESRISKMHDETSKRIDMYQDKLEKANEKMEALREKMQAEVDMLKSQYGEKEA